ncbi:MAG: tryptophan 2,3-dioxygenase [Myxococcota bacterium]|jgi:tryptophan 2,3-dioxygenase
MNAEDSHKPVNYNEYLKIQELVNLQQPLSDGPEHDELLFIIIHQVYELWFRQVLHEVQHLIPRLNAGDTHGALSTFKRVLTILKVMVAQVDVIETMTPTSFNSFRDRLDTASGFQSFQFRQFEFAMGLKNAKKLAHHTHDPVAYAILKAQFEAPSLWDAYLRFLATRGVDVPASSLDRDVTLSVVGDDALHPALIAVYKDHPLLQMVSERMVDLDEGLQEWRYRHVKMVERTIGTKIGTGGSDGAAYLRSTLFRPLFPDLWAIRSAL